MTRNRIALASTPALDARLDFFGGLEYDDIATAETFPGECDAIERELDARYYANHEDDRVRQGMGAYVPTWS